MAAKRVFKSKKKLSTVRAVYRKWGDWDTGDVLVGTYRGSQTDKYDKPNWLIEVESAFFTDKKAAKKLEGQVIGLNSQGEVDRAMEKAEEGQIVQFTYNGMERMDGGPYKGKDKHLVDVEVGSFSDEGEEETEEDDDKYERRTRGSRDEDEDEEEDDL